MNIEYITKTLIGTKCVYLLAEFIIFDDVILKSVQT